MNRHGSDHEHREETPILRKCQEFSRELAFAITATRTRVRGSVTFLLGCDARSIAPSRAFFRDLSRHWQRRRATTTRFARRSARNERTDARRDEHDARVYRYYADRPSAGTATEEASRRRRRRLTYDYRHLAAIIRRRSLKWKAPRGWPSARTTSFRDDLASERVENNN